MVKEDALALSSTSRSLRGKAPLDISRQVVLAALWAARKSKVMDHDRQTRTPLMDDLRVLCQQITMLEVDSIPPSMLEMTV